MSTLPPGFTKDNKVSDAWFKKGKVGDFIRGTLTTVRQIESQMPGKEGTMVNVYEIKATQGSWHELDEKKQPMEKPVTVQPGQMVLVSGTAGIDNGMRNYKPGHIVGFHYSEERPAKQKGFNPTKVVDVYEFGKDDAWLKEQASPMAGGTKAETEDIPFI